MISANDRIQLDFAIGQEMRRLEDENAELRRRVTALEIQLHIRDADDLAFTDEGIWLRLARRLGREAAGGQHGDS